MKSLRIVIALTLFGVALGAHAANGLVWVQVQGTRFTLAGQPGKQVKLYTDSIQSSMAVEIPTRGKPDGTVYLVYGDLRGTDIWKAEFLGKLAKP